MEFAPPPPPGGMNGAGASPGAPPETSPDSVAYTPSGPPPDAPPAAPPAPPAPPAPAEAPRASTGGFSELGDADAAPPPAAPAAPPAPPAPAPMDTTPAAPAPVKAEPAPAAAPEVPPRPVERYFLTARLERGQIGGKHQQGVVLHGPWRNQLNVVGAQARYNLDVAQNPVPPDITDLPPSGQRGPASHFIAFVA